MIWVPAFAGMSGYIGIERYLTIQIANLAGVPPLVLLVLLVRLVANLTSPIAQVAPPPGPHLHPPPPSLFRRVATQEHLIARL